MSDRRPTLLLWALCTAVFASAAEGGENDKNKKDEYPSFAGPPHAESRPGCLLSQFP